MKCLLLNYLSAMYWNYSSPLYFIFRKTTAESLRLSAAVSMPLLTNCYVFVQRELQMERVRVYYT